MKDLQFFDCNVCVGKPGYKHRLQIWRTEEILEVMEQCGIAGALVYHGLAKAHSPLYGNRLLEDEIIKSPRLFGCWVAVPDAAGDFPSPTEMIAEMNGKNIRAAKIFPTTNRFETDEYAAGKLLAALEAAGLPLLVDAAEISFGQLAGILKHHPDLAVILQGLFWGQERRLYSLMDEYKNLGTEFSRLQSNEIIEVLYERYGADRLFFGSGLPGSSPGAARALIDYARIPDEAKRQIAGGNLAKLLGQFPPHAAMPDRDEITQQASRGLPLEIPVLDSHTHLIEDGGGTGSGFPMARGDIDSMIKAYRALGIQKMSIAPWIGIYGDSEAGNRIAESAIRKYPEEVVGYVTIDPNYSDVATEARKWHVEKGFKGIKPYYTTHKYKYTDKVYEPWWKLGNEKRLYALVDPGLYDEQEYLNHIEELAIRYPEVNIFMDHAGRTFEIAVDYARIAKKYDNVTLQLTFTTVVQGVIEYLVGEVGADKILFGTDSPMRDPRPQVGWLAYANISFEDKKKIFGGNFARILDRCLV